jgi:hypothetical protein
VQFWPLQTLHYYSIQSDAVTSQSDGDCRRKKKKKKKKKSMRLSTKSETLLSFDGTPHPEACVCAVLSYPYSILKQAQNL